MAKLNIGTRVEQTTVERLDRIARVLSEQTPGLEVNRSDAARMAIELSLDALERRAGITSAAPTPKPAQKKPAQKKPPRKPAK